MKVLIVPNLNKPQAKEILQQAVCVLQQANAQVFVCEQDLVKNQQGNIQYLPQKQAIEHCDAVVTIGGDGTMLRAVGEIYPKQKPVLGINLGRLGFLATCEVSEIEQKLTLLAKGQFSVDERMMIQAVVHQPEQEDCVLCALNDIVIFKGLRTQTIGLQAFCENALVGCYRGDGAVIATPTGSTAYSLSAGGPVLDCLLECMLLTPICSHSMQSPPIVFSANRRLCVQVKCDGEEPIYLSADGNAGIAVHPQSRIELCRAECSAALVQFEQKNQLEAIEKKLIGKVTL